MDTFRAGSKGIRLIGGDDWIVYYYDYVSAEKVSDDDEYIEDHNDQNHDCLEPHFPISFKTVT